VHPNGASTVAGISCSLPRLNTCDILIFRRRAALDQLGDRLQDSNRNLGRPDKLTVIFGRRITKQYSGKLQTEIEDLHLGVTNAPGRSIGLESSRFSERLYRDPAG
jgi:hypothetical protein